MATGSGAAIRTEGLSKFNGRQRGVENLDLEVGRGEIFGWLGPNGAGKTTTIRMLLNLIRPTGGRASVLGLDTVADSIEVRRRCGYLPGELTLYENMTGRAFLGYFAGLRALRDQSHAHDLAERLDLALDRSIGTLSKGNKQKIGLVQALMHSPPVLIPRSDRRPERRASPWASHRRWPPLRIL
jgi:ABC-2 type transport system ATP-binding protein